MKKKKIQISLVSQCANWRTTCIHDTDVYVYLNFINVYDHTLFKFEIMLREGSRAGLRMNTFDNSKITTLKERNKAF